MLRSIKEMIGYKINAKDGDIGSVEQFYFDDQNWFIRYLVVDTGQWLPGKQVLIAPAAFYDQPDWQGKRFPVILTKEMVKNSPMIYADKPVSRQKEMEMVKYYNWPIYWEASPGGPLPSMVAPTSMTRPEKRDIDVSEKQDEDSHLRSTKEVSGYHIQAEDGEIGHVEDFIVDDDNWIIRYLVIDTRNWLPGKKVLIPPPWIDRINWAESKVYINLTREDIKQSPEYDPSSPVNREYEERFYDYYGRPKYWS